jgi:hypothetical protein
MPTPPPIALPCTLAITNLGALRIALITAAKPEKNFFPISKSAIEVSSSKEAPAQNVFSPPLFKTMTFVSLCFPAFSI